MTTIAIISYATPSYEKHLDKMLESLHRLACEPGWAFATCLKPEVILRALSKPEHKDVDYFIYVDADSVWKAWPAQVIEQWEEFKKWGTREDWYFGAPLLDCAYHRLHWVVPCHDSEVLTGTLVFRNCEAARDLVQHWKWRCALRASAGDQPALQLEVEKRGLLPPKGSALGLGGIHGMMWMGLEWCWLPKGYTRDKDGVHFTTTTKGHPYILHLLASETNKKGK